MLREYRAILNERDSYDIGSTGWKAAQIKLEDLIERGLKEGERMIAYEVYDDICSLLDCGADMEDEKIQKSIKMLEENGFEDLVGKIEDLFEE